MAVLTRGERMGGYTVQSLIKENLYTETYRVENEDGNPFFLKLFVTRRLPEKLIDAESGTVFEIMYCQKMKHKNIVSFVGSGTYDSSAEGACQYYLTNYFSGELLAEKIQREGSLKQEEALVIFRAILDALRFLHDQGLYHNDVTPRNIMLPATPDGSPQLIDLGHVSTRCSGKVPFDTSDLELHYCANETFGGIYDEQSDIFSATAVLYAMLTGRKPWPMDFDEGMKRTRKAFLMKESRKERPLDLDNVNADDRTKAILAKGLAVAYNDRYKDVNRVIADMESEKTPEAPKPKKETPASDHPQSGFSRETESPNKTEFEIRRGNGNGFKDIAGMKELKDYLSQRVIFVIKNKEKVEKYKLTTPNGMLLYGPPGCGKTFVAEKFAEETGFNFILVKASDLASSFIHGSQEKIAQLFKQAEKASPIVICFDEFDALVPDRSNYGAQHYAGEVNEFLSQLNNCSKRGIFIIGTTNRPDKIDPAVLRTGRIDKQVYVPLPDKEARREMFLIHLKGRPYNSEAIDADKLSELSDGFIASDIAYVVNDAAMIAAYTDQDITEELLETSVKNTHPSLRADTLQMYDEIKKKMENTERRNMVRKIGFIQ